MPLTLFLKNVTYQIVIRKTNYRKELTRQKKKRSGEKKSKNTKINHDQI